MNQEKDKIVKRDTVFSLRFSWLCKTSTVTCYRVILVVIEAGHAHVMKFLPLSCELSIFDAVTVIF
jgi:hypothetical protein